VNRLAKHRLQASSRLSSPRTLRKVSCLTGEARRGQVFRRRRRAHGQAHVVAVLLLKEVIRVEDLGGKILGDRGAVHNLAARFARRARSFTSLGTRPSSAS